ARWCAGLLCPVVLLPAGLPARLSDAQMRGVLLHELLHIQRGDLWVNAVQALLQIVYWWHPLVWLAHGRLRLGREEAVDERVMVELGEDAEVYPPTLLEVAKAALAAPSFSLSFLGILESGGALRRRLRRLLEYPLPRQANLGWAGLGLT